MSSLKSKRVITAVIFCGMVFLSSIFALQGSLLEYVIGYYELGSSDQGLAALLSSFGGMAAFVLALFMIGRVRKLRLLTAGFSFGAVFLGCLTFLPPFPVYIGLWFLTGIGMGLMDTLLSSCIADLYTGEAATRTMCNLHSTFGITSMAMPLVYSGLISGGLNWNWIYLIIAVFGAVLVGVLLSADRKAESGDTVRSEKRMTLADMRNVLRSGTLPVYVLAMFFHGFFMGGMNNWVNYYVGTTLNSSLGSTALSFMFTGVLLARFLMPYTGIKPEKLIRYAGLAAAAVLLAVLPFSSGLVVCIGIAVSCFCFGAMIPCMLNVACAETKESTLMATSLMMLALYLGQGIAPPVLGFCEATVGLRFGMCLCAVFMVLTSLTFILQKKKR